MPRLDKKGESIDLLGADALNAVIDDTTIVTYQAIRRGVERGAKILRKAVRKKNFGWRDKSGRLRRSVRLAKVKGFFVEGAGRRVRVKPYAAVVIGDYRQYSKTYAPHAHLVARGYTSGARALPLIAPDTAARRISPGNQVSMRSIRLAAVSGAISGRARALVSKAM